MIMDWFAVHTSARTEKVVHDQLQRKGLESFLPTVTRWSRWKDRKKAIAWPLFPGYCFAHVDPVDRLAILTCSGVAGIVSFGGTPAPIPAYQIESLRALVTSQLQFDPAPFIKEGSLVEVTHGPLKGVVGRLIRKGVRARLVLSVDLIGQGVTVEVDAADVAKW
jgi:transcription antitermination factor NusG